MAKKTDKKDTKDGYWSFPDMNRAIEVGLYYGFTRAKPISIEKTDRDQAKQLISASTSHPYTIYPEEKIALLREYFSKGMPPLPITILHERSIQQDKKKLDYCLDIIGSTKSISDATVIKTAFEIIYGEGYEDVTLEINTVGDRESLARFTRDLTNYFRKHINILHAECRNMLKKGPFTIISCPHEKCQIVKHAAPHPMNYLSEPSRVHFKELLEFLEMTKIPYTLNPNLVDSHEFAAHTIFRIYGKESEGKNTELIASGIRWAGLAKKIGLKKDVPGISAVVSLKRQKSDSKLHKKIKKPELYFIQMGPEAKFKSFQIIETLRKAKIPLYHALSKDKLAVQLGTAEHLRVPYMLIMGQKESIENSVLVRNAATSSQETVKIANLAQYLKQLLK